MNPVTLSILIPLYNEEEFAPTILERITAALSSACASGTLSAEVIVVDDGSTDDSVAMVESYQRANPHLPIELVRHSRNLGKGAAVRTALRRANGEFCIIQDADLEYDPREYPILLRPLIAGDADVVFGSRFLSSGERRVLYFWHSVANRFLTTLANMAADLNMSDVETCYKAFRTSLAQSIPWRANRFGIDPELAIKFAKRQARVYEVPITYHGRTYQEGKKIGLTDAFTVLLTILENWLSNDIYTDRDFGILDGMARALQFNRWMADTVAPFLGENILEIGAGIGNLTRLLCRRKLRYIAADVSAENLSLLKTRLQYRPNLEIAVCDLTRSEDFDPYRAAMDSVVCLNVLEHTQDDVEGLRNLYSCLRPGGQAIVLVPQGPDNFGTLDETLHHYRRYRPAELAEKMIAAGFELEHLLPFNRATYPAWFVNGRILRRRYFGRFQLKVFDALVPLWRVVDRQLPWPPTSLVAIGRRPD